MSDNNDKNTDPTTPRVYLARFQGRRMGGIGISYHIEKFVEADTPEAARLKLYETHEHISGLILKVWT